MISIGLPTFNRKESLKRALDSLLDQDYRNFEIILADNHSEDGTEQLCLEYAAKDERIKYFRHKENIGMVNNAIFIFDHIVGDYFMWASDDDYWGSNLLSRLKNGLDNGPECGVAMSSLQEVFNDGTKGRIFNFMGIDKMSSGQVFDCVQFKKPIAAHFFICGLFRTEVMRKLLWRPVHHVIGPDEVMMQEAALFTKFCPIPDLLWFKTIHNIPREQQYSAEYVRVFQDSRAYTKRFFASVQRLIQSPNIPFKNKFLIPLKIFTLLWADRKHYLRENLPTLFKLLKHSRRVWREYVNQ